MRNLSDEEEGKLQMTQYLLSINYYDFLNILCVFMPGLLHTESHSFQRHLTLSHMRRVSAANMSPWSLDMLIMVESTPLEGQTFEKKHKKH